MNEILAQVRRAAGVEALTHRWVRRVAVMVGFAALTALGAYVSIPLPGTPVPVTLQTLVVSLSGLLLGARLGAGAQTIYLVAGALGAPVFSGGALGLAHLFGPTGGYLLAYPAAAALTGALASLAGARRSLGSALVLGIGTFLGTGVVFVGGASQLALLTGDVGLAVQQGVLPFIVGDLLKVGVAVLIALRLRNRTLGLL
ncbi:MAG: biotin transporter BioY [Longimicrobiales bacterium]